jgi:hypothetical protein
MWLCTQQVVSATQFVWEWAIMGYLFLDTKSSGVKGWLIDRVWMWVLSKASQLAALKKKFHRQMNFNV